MVISLIFGGYITKDYYKCVANLEKSKLDALFLETFFIN